MMAPLPATDAVRLSAGQLAPDLDQDPDAVPRVQFSPRRQQLQSKLAYHVVERNGQTRQLLA